MDTLTRLAALLHEMGDLVAGLAQSAPSASAPDTMIDQAEAARRLGLTHQRVGELARDGSLRGLKVGRFWHFRTAALTAFAQSTEPVPTAPRGRAPVPVKPLAEASRRLRARTA